MEKKRAANNRTLRLDEADRERLRPRLLTAGGLEAGASFEDRTIHADLLDVLPLLPDCFADLIVIDPPYNLTKNFGTVKFGAMPSKDYAEYIATWFHEVCRKLKPDGSMYVCGDWRCTAALQAAMEQELTVLNRITWQREKGRGARANWKNAMEDIWFGVKDPKHFHFDVESVMMKRRVIAPYRENGRPKDWDETAEGKFRLTYPSNFWDDISIPFWSMPENTDHPTQKPEKLYAKLILASSRPGDLVFDPFLGSGTTSVVARKLGRRFCGVEIDEEYCLLAEKRLENAETDKTIQGYHDGLFWERNTLALQKATKTTDRKPARKAHTDPQLF